MLEILNKTKFPAAIVPGLDKEGQGFAVVVVKGTFILRGTGGPGKLAEKQIPVQFGDSFRGEPGKSSVLDGSDTDLRKPQTDIVLKGNAYGGSQNVPFVDVTVEVSSLAKMVRVFGDRRWERILLRWLASNPLPFDKIPLIYERSFGGWDTSRDDPARHKFCPENPVGTGYSAYGDSKQLEGMLLPNLEDPKHQIRGWRDKPPVAGFGCVGHGWQPRASLAGTYDDAWSKGRCPLLPADFDDRFYQAASSGMVCPTRLRGGEPIRVTGASPDHVLTATVPAGSVTLTLWLKGQPSDHVPVLDTIVIEPDENRLLLTWRATVPCGKDFLYVDGVRVRSTWS